MVELKNLNIDFTPNKETPYFQANHHKRIRFILDKLTLKNLKSILEKIFKTKSIQTIFISGYNFQNKNIYVKTGIGKVIQLKNWQEITENLYHTPDGRVILTKLKKLNCTDVYHYCSSIKKGNPESYIVFYSDDYLLYINSDVIDIISNNTENIQMLKKAFKPLYNTYYEHN